MAATGRSRRKGTASFAPVPLRPVGGAGAGDCRDRAIQEAEPRARALVGALHDILPRSVLEVWRKARGRVASPAYDGSFLRPEFARESGLLARWAGAPNAPERMARLHADETIPVYLGVQPAHAETVTLMMNRMGLGWSAPLRDRRLVDFILSVPPEQLRRNGLPRYLARRVLADRMPPEALAEKGYFSPLRIPRNG